MPTSKARAALAERSQGWCEMSLDGCRGRASQWAHRRKQGMGGRHGDAAAVNGSLSNAYHTCDACHAWQHANPAEAVAQQLMLREGDDPATTPARYRGRLVWLTDDGGVVDVENGWPEPVLRVLAAPMFGWRATDNPEGDTWQ